MKKIFSVLILLFSTIAFAQLKGIVSDMNGNPLPFVTIHIENTYIGTTTNEVGEYEINIKPSKYVIVFQYLGFKTQKIKYVIERFEKKLDVKLEEENITLNEVVIDKKNNPANEVIRNAIASKKANSEQTSKYEADFYSRGIFRIKDAPKQILGQKFDYFDELLDSTRSGILYLSETVSKITFQKPDKLKETIIASKVSGNDNGFSFNNAASADFDFYENYLPFQVKVISPIADNAFIYYRYKLEGTFFDSDKHQINKIKVIPRRDSEPVVDGYIYIVEDSWAIYAVDLTLKGDRIQTPAITHLFLKQNYSYNSINNIWVKNTQTLDFIAGLFNIKVSGRFTYVYSDYKFEPKFDKNTFTREILSFQNDSNKKDDPFWNKTRPIPLTAEENTDYLKKDLLQTKKKSEQYLDSVDKKSNKPRILDFLTGYTYQNSFKKWQLRYDGFLRGISFNTVQGLNFTTGFSYTKRDDDLRTYSTIGTTFNYGKSENRFRGTAYYTNRFNNQNFSEFRGSAGSTVAQFNEDNPISKFLNGVSSLFFHNNFMKLYERNFAKASFGREVTNGVYLNASIDYSERRPLYNTTDRVIINDSRPYTSNNPLLPYDYTTAAIEKHNLAIAGIKAKFTFGQQYWSRPDGKINIPNDKYPVLYVGYEKGFAGNESKYNYDLVNARLTYDISIANKGDLAINLKAGKFFNAEQISFVDYKHFNGNQTHIGTADRYLNVYNLLPYYSQSTNDSYIEIHAEHNDKGYIMNKIPLLNKLKSTLVLGYHGLIVPQRAPYNEFTVGLDNLGFGKFRFFRIDYVHSYQSGNHGDGVVFGIKLLNILE